MRSDFVWILLNPRGEVLGAYKKRENAEFDIPVKSRMFKKQCSEAKWLYGKLNKYKLVRKIIKDSSGLPGGSKI